MAQPPLFPLLLRQVFISAVTAAAAATAAYPADTPAKWIQDSVWVCVTPWQVCAKSVAADGSEDVLVSTLLFSCRKAKDTSLCWLFFLCWCLVFILIFWFWMQKVPLNLNGRIQASKSWRHNLSDVSWTSAVALNLQSHSFIFVSRTRALRNTPGLSASLAALQKPLWCQSHLDASFRLKKYGMLVSCAKASMVRSKHAYPASNPVHSG